jgi:hypothetical protein
MSIESFVVPYQSVGEKPERLNNALLYPVMVTT